MDSDQLEKILKTIKTQVDESVSVSIPIHVNGKVKALTEQLNQYIKDDTDWKKKDSEWKENAQPAVKLGSNLITFGGVFKWVLITGTSVGGFIIMINTIKNILN